MRQRARLRWRAAHAGQAAFQTVPIRHLSEPKPALNAKHASKPSAKQSAQRLRVLPRPARLIPARLIPALHLLAALPRVPLLIAVRQHVLLRLAMRQGVRLLLALLQVALLRPARPLPKPFQLTRRLPDGA